MTGITGIELGYGVVAALQQQNLENKFLKFLYSCLKRFEKWSSEKKMRKQGNLTGMTGRTGIKP